MGLLIVLIVIVIGLLYFISKQVRDNKTRLNVGLADLESLKSKVAELDSGHQPRQLNYEQIINDQNLQFGGNMFAGDEEEDVDLNDVNERHNDDVDVDEEDEDEDVDVDEDEDENVDEDEDEDVDEDENVDEDEDEDVDVDEDEDENVDEDEKDVDVEEEGIDVEEEGVDVNEGDNVDGDEVPDSNLEDGGNVLETESEDHDVDVGEGEDVKNIELGSSSSASTPSKRRHKQPADKAKDYPVGYKVVSEFDDCTYEVVLDARNRARWKRLVA